MQEGVKDKINRIAVITTLRKIIKTLNLAVLT
jgi:hypothetical protein